jgi:hypothetical protein
MLGVLEDGHIRVIIRADSKVKENFPGIFPLLTKNEIHDKNAGTARVENTTHNKRLSTAVSRFGERPGEGVNLSLGILTFPPFVISITQKVLKTST